MADGSQSEVGVPPKTAELFLNKIKEHAEVLPPTTYSVPNEYDLSRFDEYKRMCAEGFINLARDYLTYPTFIDNFPDHNTRREWRTKTVGEIRDQHGQEVADQFNQFYIRHALKGNRLSTIRGYVTELLDINGSPHEPLTNLAEIIKTNSPELIEYKEIGPDGKEITKYRSFDPMDGLNKQQKIQRVKVIKGAVVAALNSLANKTEETA